MCVDGGLQPAGLLGQVHHQRRRHGELGCAAGPLRRRELLQRLPILAEWVNLALGVARGTSRRLLSQADAVEAIKSTRMGHRAAESTAHSGRAASRSLLDFIAIDAAAPAPSPAADGSISADIPSHPCAPMSSCSPSGHKPGSCDVS
eukprot:jgi/Ulvmu1/19/UM001_0020.1